MNATNTSHVRPSKIINYELSALCALLVLHPSSLKCYCSSSLRKTCHFGKSNVREANDILMFGPSTANSLLVKHTDMRQNCQPQCNLTF